MESEAPVALPQESVIKSPEPQVEGTHNAGRQTVDIITQIQTQGPHEGLKILAGLKRDTENQDDASGEVEGQTQEQPEAQQEPMKSMADEQTDDRDNDSQTSENEKQEQKEFNADEQVARLTTDVVELIGEVAAEDLFSQLTTADLTSLRRILSTPGLRDIDISTFILSRLIPTKVTDPMAQALSRMQQGDTPQGKQEVQKVFKAFRTDFYEKLDTEIPPEAIMGMEPIENIEDPQAALQTLLQRNTELYNAIIKMKHLQPYSFIDSVIKRASRNVEAKIRKRMQEQETQELEIAA